MTLDEYNAAVTKLRELMTADQSVCAHGLTKANCLTCADVWVGPGGVTFPNPNKKTAERK